MGGVDRSDRRVATNSTARKTLRWYIKLFFYVIDVLISNANIICNLIQENNLYAAQYADN